MVLFVLLYRLPSRARSLLERRFLISMSLFFTLLNKGYDDMMRIVLK